MSLPVVYTSPVNPLHYTNPRYVNFLVCHFAKLSLCNNSQNYVRKRFNEC